MVPLPITGVIRMRLTNTCGRAARKLMSYGEKSKRTSQTAQAFSSGCLLIGSRMALVAQLGLPSCQWIGMKFARAVSGSG